MQPSDPRWAYDQYWVPYLPAPLVVTSPGAGLDVAAYRRMGGVIPTWPAPAAQATYTRYRRRRRQVPCLNDSDHLRRALRSLRLAQCATPTVPAPGAVTACAGLGQLEPIMEAASFEIEGRVERTVVDAFQKWVLPPVIGAVVFSIFAFGLAASAYRNALKRNPRRRRRRRRRR